MQTQTPILCAYSLEPTQEPLDEARAIAEIASSRLAWVSVYGDHVDTADWLLRHLSYLDPLIIAALLAEETRPRCEVMQQGVMLILRGVNLAEGAQPEDMVSIRMWVDPHRIISVQKRPLQAVDKLKEAYDKQSGPCDAGAFVTKLVGQMLDVMDPVLADIDERIDDMEEILMTSPSASMRHELALLRRRALHLKRYISPQREAISVLKSHPVNWVASEDRLALQEHYDRLSRFIEHLDSMRERCQIIQDELATTLADRLNHNTYILTIVAAIFLPLGFITGLLGVNVGGIPWADNPHGFSRVVMYSGAIIAAEIAVFKWLRWL